MEFSYRCSLCGKHYGIGPEATVCPDCSRGQRKDRPLEGVLEVELSGIAPPDFDVFDLLPVNRDYFPPIPVGNTPLWTPENIRKATGFKSLFIKDDGANPTSSLQGPGLVSGVRRSQNVRHRRHRPGLHRQRRIFHGRRRGCGRAENHLVSAADDTVGQAGAGAPIRRHGLSGQRQPTTRPTRCPWNFPGEKGD